MTGRVVLLGATGFTGRLVAEALVRAGTAPVLAGRSEQALVDLVGDLAGLGPIDAAPTWQRADVTDPASVRALVTSPEDVLVTTVGPFTRLGRPALDAAVDQGCGYVDSTGEPAFVRGVFEDAGVRALASGARLLTAFGYDYVPGNLAGALLLRDVAGLGATRIDIGYFLRGGGSISSGTRASAAMALTQRAFAFRGGRLSSHAGGVATFDVDGRRRDALPVGGSEHFALPRLDAGLLDVGVYLGWAGSLTRAAHASGLAIGTVRRLPLAGRVVDAAVAWGGGSATGEGPDASARARTATVVSARALDAVGREVGRVLVEGPSPYDLTAELMAWGAAMLLTGQASGPGALGPADAFGLDALEAGCADMGLRRVG